MNINLKVTSNFQKHFKTTKKIVISQGGGRSGKTYSILQLLIIKAMTEKKIIISVVGENMPFVKRGVIRDFRNIMIESSLWDDSRFNKTESVYKFITGSIIEFFSVENYGRALGSARDYLFINECNNIQYETCFQLMARTRKQTYLDFNPVDKFWVHSEIIENKEFEGQFEFIKTTFIGNEMLDESIKQMMLARAAKDENYKRVYVLGEVGKIEGLIFKDYELIDNIPNNIILNCQQYFGLDWGWSNDPSSIINVFITSTSEQRVKDIYIDELYYETQTHNRELANIIKSNIEKVDYEVIADSSEPKSIDELYNYGINIFAADKPSGSVNFGIELMQQANIYVTKRSVNTIKELRNYKWAVDKNGNVIKNSKGKPVPIDNYNHSLDAIRYVAIHHMNKINQYHDIPKSIYDDSGWDIM